MINQTTCIRLPADSIYLRCRICGGRGQHGGTRRLGRWKLAGRKPKGRMREKWSVLSRYSRVRRGIYFVNGRLVMGREKPILRYFEEKRNTKGRQGILREKRDAKRRHGVPRGHKGY